MEPFTPGAAPGCIAPSAYSAPPDPLAVFKRPTSKGREGEGRGKERGREGEERGRVGPLQLETGYGSGGGDRREKGRDGRELGLGRPCRHFFFPTLSTMFV